MATLPVQDVAFSALLGRIRTHPEEVISSRVLASLIRETTGQPNHRTYIDRLLSDRHLEPIVGQRNINRYRIPQAHHAVAVRPEPVTPKASPRVLQAGPGLQGIRDAAGLLRDQIAAFRGGGMEKGIMEILALSDNEMCLLQSELDDAGLFAEDLLRLHDIAPRLRANRCMIDPED